MKARELMTSDHLWVCSETTDARQVAKLMLEHNVGSIPVVDNAGRLEGILTDRDICCRIVAEGRSFETPARDIMSGPVRTCHADAELPEIEEIMRDYRVRRLPVVDDDRKLQGFISIGDLAKHCHGLFKEHQVVQTLEAISTG